MSTVLLIAAKENRDALRDGRFRWIVFVLGVLLIGSLITGWLHYERTQEDRNQASAAERQVWVEQGEKNPHSAAHYGTYAFKPYMPLGAVDRGLEPYTGTTVFLEGHSRNPEVFRAADDLTAAHRLGQLVASTVLQFLVPLLIILLVFSMFCGEREQGTLRFVLSTGVSRKQLALGKILGSSVPLSIVLIPATLAGVLALALFGGPDSALWSWSRFGLLTLAYLAYFAVFMGLSLIVSALAPSSRFSLVLLTGFWFMNCFVLPRLAVDVFERTTPLPTAADFDAAINEDIRGLIAWSERTEQVTQRLMKEQNVTEVEDLTADPYGTLLLEAEDDETQVYRKHFNALNAKYQRQNQQNQAAGLLAPLVSLRSLSMALSGTDFNHHLQFAEAAEEYRFAYVQNLNTNLAQNMKPGERYLADRALWEAIEAFSYQPPTLSKVLGQQWLPLLLLGLWVAVIAVIIPVSLPRMRVF